MGDGTSELTRKRPSRQRKESRREAVLALPCDAGKQLSEVTAPLGPPILDASASSVLTARSFRIDSSFVANEIAF